MIAGADAYRGSWVVALRDEQGRTRLEFVADLAGLASRPELAHAVVDVPIGLLESGTRECDQLARRRLGARRNSVFTAPLRGMLGATTQAEASRMRYSIEGKRVSIQAACILPLVRAVDDLMTPELQVLIREGHPELSFAEIAGKPLTYSKRRTEGKQERMALVEHEFPDAPNAMRRFGLQGALTDILDAYAMLWTARRIQMGIASTLPRHPPVDGKGLRMEMLV